jgi:hypothetical protein
LAHNKGVREPWRLGAARKLKLTAALGLFAVSCASSGASRPLSERLPLSVPTAAVRAAWERIDGDYDTATEHVRYALFVDPERPGLYRITHYRVSRRMAGADGRARWAPGTETVIWNETPGRRVPLRCFAEARHRNWRTLWLAAGPGWRDVSPATNEFRDHMTRAIQIYYRVREEGRAGPPVG